MYKKFFGFQERPFQLVPNPAFLYLSRVHEEALAHLTYAMSQGDGFVEITGEVGTGKTTLCRAFLENLSEEGTEAAFIFNPKLDAIHLLKAINDEFGIDSTVGHIKDLIDGLNAFLLEKKAEGRKVILLIDEAQNLSKDVLEQLRLLSNLETTTSKLLQIVLVGQPELGEMLDSHELRQLGQRITLSCHLSPLSLKETREYILHRLRVASHNQTVQFTLPAIRIIHRYSGGIPRLINIACDRALLTAFGLNSRKVTAGIARSAVRELSDRRSIRRMGAGLTWRPYLAAALLCLVVLAVGMYYRPETPVKTSGAADRAAEPEARPDADSSHSSPAPGATQNAREKPAPLPDSREERHRPAAAAGSGHSASPAIRALTAEDLDRHLGGVDVVTSRRAALRAALKLWMDDPVVNPYLDSMEEDPDAFRFAARQNGLSIHWIHTDLDFLAKVNVPAILRMEVPGGVAARYVTLSGLRDGEVTLRGGLREDGVIETGQEVLYQRWTGDAYLLWNNFLNCEGTPPKSATRESMVTLKMLLQDIGFKDVEITPYYDQAVRDAVEAVQKRNGIGVDGIVGPITKIVLYNEKKGLKIPHLHGNGAGVQGSPKGVNTAGDV